MKMRAFVSAGVMCGAAAFVVPAAPALRSSALAAPAAVGFARTFTKGTALQAKGLDSKAQGDIGGYFTGGGGFNEVAEDDDEDIPLSVKMDALRRMQEFKAIQEGQTTLQSGQMRATGTALEVTVEELKQALRNGKELTEGAPFLLDCREEDEFSFCKVEGAVLIPLSEMQERYDEVPKDRPVFVMCHHGMRSMQVTRYLRTRGYPVVSNVEGGIEEWSLRIDSKVPRY
mmetsp:Transcript_6633/g.5796  ORF Transcript_6633/g.5796 Transcript_6633/m.5796 type:complete len:229 (+) Transcript_6633:3-689(+)